ncbi:MAG: flagellar basal-body rod protein FlgG [Oscillospiraceae bacterium]|jgi:flagellar basal body rod protein FlgG|nr:flagellar basal-body rod protein FlgG [Oscillospiraceae bacterium]
MIRGFYSAGSGLRTQQTALDNAANNIANVNTTGYKKQSLSFSDLLYSNLATPEGNAPQNLKVGNGVRETQADTLFTQGGVQQTGGILDFAITANGFFGVLSPDGTVRYTRDGSFKISPEQQGNYLVTADGGYVLDKNGNKILAESQDLINQIGVFDFANPYGLQQAGNNMFEKTGISGNAVGITGQLHNGYLEYSNVELADEMSSLISIQKAYQFNAKLIQTADEIENITNNLR